jgi:peptide-methionine (S)-S-oxide reductase
MVRTRVGYSGGTKKNPTYHSLGDHSEAIQIDFDPSQIPYEKLLEVFWAAHDPTSRSWSRQYKAAVFSHNNAQEKMALETKNREEAGRKSKILTEILPFTGFYLAEGYHQKYSLRQKPNLMREFTAMYPDDGDFINSTAAARVNGYVAGYGAYAALLTEINSFGLSPEESKKLTDQAYRSKR